MLGFQVRSLQENMSPMAQLLDDGSDSFWSNPTWLKPSLPSAISEEELLGVWADSLGNAVCVSAGTTSQPKLEAVLAKPPRDDIHLSMRPDEGSGWICGNATLDLVRSSSSMLHWVARDGRVSVWVRLENVDQETVDQLFASFAAIAMLRVSRWRRQVAGELRRSCPARRGIGHVASVREVQELSTAKAAPVLAVFTASWCQPCRMLAPHLEDISEKFEGRFLKMVQVDVTDIPEAAREFRVDAVPYFLVLRDGHVVERLLGNEPKAVAEAAQRHAAAFEKMQAEQ
ncbi:THL-2 [Symbiodinium sp. CCMP2456]|nr:THL-2 [Symbiodinium sp. CCMP2456]